MQKETQDCRRKSLSVTPCGSAAFTISALSYAPGTDLYGFHYGAFLVSGFHWVWQIRGACKARETWFFSPTPQQVWLCQWSCPLFLMQPSFSEPPISSLCPRLENFLESDNTSPFHFPSRDSHCLRLLLIPGWAPIPSSFFVVWPCLYMALPLKSFQFSNLLHFCSNPHEWKII